MNIEKRITKKKKKKLTSESEYWKTNNEETNNEKQNSILTIETWYIQALLSELDIRHLLECLTRC